jgi:guanylate kinase
MLSDDLRPLVASLPRGKLFIVCAPAGAGKTTIVQKALETYPNVVTSSSFTTRPMRNGEEQGKSYHFVSEEDFEKKRLRGDFLETIELHGNRYGTSRREIEEFLASGKHVLLAIDIRGAYAMQKIFSPVLVFLKAPSLDVLRDRLLGRGSENTEMLEARLAVAKEELKEEKNFQYSIVNDSLEHAFLVFSSILIAETHKNI